MTDETSGETRDNYPDLIEMLPVGLGQVKYDGHVKVRLVHALGFSLIVPDLLLLQKSLWFAPKYFTATLLNFLDDAAYAQFSYEPTEELRLLIAITRNRLLRAYDDGSFLYECQVVGPPGLDKLAIGSCVVSNDHTIDLELFHHTTNQAAVAISESRHFRGSNWNIQGNKTLKNVAYAYFTSISQISNDKDLQEIAMASDGTIKLFPTNATQPDDVVEIQVYRESTNNRRHAIKAHVPADAVAPQHIWRHDPKGQPTYYEVSRPAIFRVGLEPDTVLPFDEQIVDTRHAQLKRFDYVILGNADTEAGLTAPYNEEDTIEIFKIERTEDIFAFWLEHNNSDQFSNKIVQTMSFNNNPKKSGLT